MEKRFNYPTKSTNCANCKRAKYGRWYMGLYFCVCRKGKELDGLNPEHYEKCPNFIKKSHQSTESKEDNEGGR